MERNVLVIGAGIAGMETSLMLAKAGRKVYLVEKSPIIGGNIIKCEDVFPNLECATCMVSPIQQEVLKNENIELLMLSCVKEVRGEFGDFTIKVEKKARYVDMVDCIGCGECFEPCPVVLKNEFEQELMERKAIYLPCAGSLPNVPAIDTENCVRFKGEDCQACKEACVFEAINFEEKDEMLEIKAGAVVVATGFKIFDIKEGSKYGYGEYDDTYTSWEFERLFASNGPTGGAIQKKNGEPPKSVAIIHCVGREEKGYCSTICCMYSLKFVHYLKKKIEDVSITEFYKDMCSPGKSYDKFYREIESTGVGFQRFDTIKVSADNGAAVVKYKQNGEEGTLPVDMVILSVGLEPQKDSQELAEILGVTCDGNGFFKEENDEYAVVNSTRQGIFIAGCAQSPKDVPTSIAQAQSAAGKILSLL